MKCHLKRDFRAVGAFQGEFGQPNDLGAGASWHFSRDLSSQDKGQGSVTALNSCLSLITGADEAAGSCCDLTGFVELHSAQVGVGMRGKLGRGVIHGGVIGYEAAE